MQGKEYYLVDYLNGGHGVWAHDDAFTDIVENEKEPWLKDVDLNNLAWKYNQPLQRFETEYNDKKFLASKSLPMKTLINLFKSKPELLHDAIMNMTASELKDFYKFYQQNISLFAEYKAFLGKNSAKLDQVNTHFNKTLPRFEDSHTVLDSHGSDITSAVSDQESKHTVECEDFMLQFAGKPKQQEHGAGLFSHSGGIFEDFEDDAQEVNFFERPRLNMFSNPFAGFSYMLAGLLHELSEMEGRQRNSSSSRFSESSEAQAKGTPEKSSEKPMPKSQKNQKISSFCEFSFFPPMFELPVLIMHPISFGGYGCMPCAMFCPIHPPMQVIHVSSWSFKNQSHSKGFDDFDDFYAKSRKSQSFEGKSQSRGFHAEKFSSVSAEPKVVEFF